MANALYAKAKQAFLSKQIDLLNDTIKATLVDSADYTLDLANHDFIDDVPAGARVATVTLSGKSVTGGVFDASDPTFSSVTGDQCEYIIIWQDTGTESTSHLIAVIDTATGLPITPNGADINLVWDNGASKIFAL
ncbi:hypothetical protein [Dehalococcoides sp.]|jgi:phage tail sheath gpL-like|uniref:hypothetical protein n=1 Tax=Dehalococcoides sp. TaxID=1966486 RepID=UPI00356B1406